MHTTVAFHLLYLGWLYGWLSVSASVGTLQRAGDLEATGVHTGLVRELLRKNSGYLNFEEML